MKIKKNVMMTALAFSVAVNLNGCVYGPPFDPSNNANQNAYGPPPLEYRESEPNDASQNNNIDNIDNEARSISEDKSETDGTNE